MDIALNFSLDINPLLAVLGLSLPHLEKEEPAPSPADVPAPLAVPEQVQADSLVILLAPATSRSHSPSAS
jgi:hypothetical protein